MTILSFIVFHKAIENTIVENKIYILHGTPPSTYIKNDLQYHERNQQAFRSKYKRQKNKIRDN